MALFHLLHIGLPKDLSNLKKEQILKNLTSYPMLSMKSSKKDLIRALQSTLVGFYNTQLEQNQKIDETSQLERFKSNINTIEKKIGHVFQDKSILIQAFTQSSFLNEGLKESLKDNERLEWLGDAVLGAVIAKSLYHRYPGHSEGVLSQIRDNLVCTTACAKHMKSLQLEEFILKSKKSYSMINGHNEKVLCNTFEALLGAIYLDGGFEAVLTFWSSKFKIDATFSLPICNYKGELQERTVKRFQMEPIYKIVDVDERGHKMFHVTVFIGEKEAGFGKANTKKEATKKAAFDALQRDMYQGDLGLS